MRDAISESTAQSYAEHLQDGAEFPPVIVFHDGADYWLADGFHRCKAYEIAGIADVPADVRSGSRIEAVRYALKANATNGRPRTGDDMRRAYDVAVRNELCDPTDSEALKELLGCSLRWARSLTQAARTKAKAQRDAEIMRLAEQGKTQREIAEEVGVSVGMVNAGVQKRNSSEIEQNAEPVPTAPADDYDKAIQAEAKRIEKQRANKKRELLEQKKKEYQDQSARAVAMQPEIYIMDAIDFLNKFPADSIDALITDPPYMTDVQDIHSFTADWLSVALQKIKPDGRAYICSGAYPEEMFAYLNVLNKQKKFIVDNPLVWTYRNTLGQTPKMKYNLNYQLIWHLYSSDSKELDTSVTNEMFSVQDISAPDGRLGNRLHAWQKPDELARRLVRHSTQQNDTVVDCFACTGTFLIEAARLDRKAIGCDYSIKNATIAEARGCTIIGG